MYRAVKLTAATLLLSCLFYVGFQPDNEPHQASLLAASSGVTIDVTTFGAVGDGTTDDSSAFQRAIDILELTGGTLYVPPNRAYCIGTKVEVKSLYPIWIKSDMAPRSIPGALADTHGDKATIRPISALTYMFEWTYPTGEGFADTGGGGIEGICFADWIEPANTNRNVAISGAVHVLSANFFEINRCSFMWLDGRALKTTNTTITRLQDCNIYNCGGTSKPVIDVGDGVNFSGVYIRGLFCEMSYATAVKINAGSGLNLREFYFENEPSNANTFIDGTDGGAYISDGTFASNGAKSIILGYAPGANQGSIIDGVTINNMPGAAVAHIEVLAGATRTLMRNVAIVSNGTQTGTSIDWKANDGMISGLHMTTAGKIDISTAARCKLSDIYLYAPGNSAGSYAIDLGTNTLEGAEIVGFTTAPPHGIRTTTGVVRNCTVYGLDGGNGIVATGLAVLKDNYCHTLDGGTPFTYFNGIYASGNA
jgi:hypothetical protein